MTTPIFQAQGTLAANTNGNLSITLPAYAANDIVILIASYYGPNSAVTVGYPSLASPWSNILSTDDYGYQVDYLGTGRLVGGFSIWWAMATSTSSLGTSVSITRPTGWDTGTDTCWIGRAYVIRGCITSGIPYEYNGELFVGGSPVYDYFAVLTNANGLFPSIPYITGGDRLSIMFFISQDNQSEGSGPTGWTAGTLGTTTTGTDGSIQTWRLSGVNAPITLGNSNIAAPQQGSYILMAITFRPPNPRYTLVT